MTRWAACAVTLGFALNASGCFYLSGTIESQRVDVSERLESRVETLSVPGTEVVTVQTTLDGAMLAVEAVLSRECRETRFETWQNYDKTVQSLPWTHWWMFGSGAAVTLAGGITTGMGSTYANTPSNPVGSVPLPSVEERRDTGDRMLIAGSIVLSTGLAVLTSELIDALMLTDTRTPTDKVIKPVPGERVDCEDLPAKDHAIWLETLPSGDEMTRRVTLVTDEFGRATIDLRDAQFDDFPYGDPFAMISCEHCRGWNLTLMPDSAAALAIHRHDREALEGWTATYSRHSDPETVKRVQEAKKRREVIDLGNAITFRTGSSQLRKSAGPHLDRAADFLLKRRNLQLRIEGHTDNTGSESKNRDLSRRRAEAVKKYLVRRGVPADRLITVGMASSQPIESNRSEAGRRANRRYHFQLLED